MSDKVPFLCDILKNDFLDKSKKCSFAFLGLSSLIKGGIELKNKKFLKLLLPITTLFTNAGMFYWTPEDEKIQDYVLYGMILLTFLDITRIFLSKEESQNTSIEKKVEGEVGNKEGNKEGEEEGEAENNEKSKKFTKEEIGILKAQVGTSPKPYEIIKKILELKIEEINNSEEEEEKDVKITCLAIKTYLI